MKNLVITAACGLEVEKVEFFLKSLRNYYNEEIFFLIGKQDSKIKELLKIFQNLKIKLNMLLQILIKKKL